MAKVKKVAVNEIEYLDGKVKKIAAPTAMFEVDEDVAKRLEKLNAVREPTEAEMALYEKQNRTSRAKAVTADTSDAGGDGDQTGSEDESQVGGTGAQGADSETKAKAKSTPAKNKRQAAPV